ncbi:G patch domain-containing protein 1 homolog [Coccinella septempunctata]|uniref:G patch domain-containing protein 1 homolog n=1 Tax=Coccinella septempunctata TaxID=41139 RepID=UPI001D08A54E|nr:G patch domain-containing protein 1 homolog [Coccinella septempunctata]
MSDNEEENFCFYGKPLDPYDEDAFPKKRPITVEEQIATDSQGRRRFHGAFTGGFSAGFFNTVGSLEGWTPSEFKSSRGDKQKHVTRNPEDFMDDEDMDEFGFAPQSIRATKDYDTSKKRKRKVFSEGPIPGEPVLHTLLTAGNETVGYLLLKNIGMKEKIKTRDEECSTNRTYGCEMPKTSSLPEKLDTSDYELPEFYNKFLMNPKNDTFSLGYVGLDKSQFNLFKSSDLIVQEKNKKLSIRGQAFGVGAFENDDDDIYAKEDMSNYDFELTKERVKSVNNLNNPTEKVFNTFLKAKVNTFRREIYPPPVIPKSFTGKHKVKKSRFEPIATPEADKISRSKIDPTHRAELLGEETNEKYTASKSVKSHSNYVDEKYIKKEEPSETGKNMNVPGDIPKKTGFDPSSLWNDRFVTGAQDDEATNILAPVKKYESDHYSKEMRDAAKLKMFGPLTRISEDWQPCSLLCKRFNVPEPLADKPRATQNRIKMKNLIFEYQKHHEENVAFKSGLTQVAPEPPELITIDDIPTESKSQDSENVDDPKISETQVAEVKQEVVETDDNNEKIQQLKTEQNDKVPDVTDRLNIEEKGDLFRAVFLSSSESEDEEDSNENVEERDDTSDKRELELKSNMLGEDLQLPKIKPLKEGILSGLNFKSVHTFTKPLVENKEATAETTTPTTDGSSTNESNLYGPKLPETLQIRNIIASATSSSSLKKYSESSSDEWVEKDDVEKPKKKKKKQKKHKSSHKKKHKHSKKNS